MPPGWNVGHSSGQILFFFNYVGNLLELLLYKSYLRFSSEHACGVYVTTINVRANKASALL